MTNVVIAVLATVLGYTTSAVVAEVRSHDPAAARMVVAEAPAQFRPIRSAEAPAFASTSAPAMNLRDAAAPQLSAARSFVIVPVGAVR